MGRPKGVSNKRPAAQQRQTPRFSLENGTSIERSRPDPNTRDTNGGGISKSLSHTGSSKESQPHVPQLQQQLATPMSSIDAGGPIQYELGNLTLNDRMDMSRPNHILDFDSREIDAEDLMHSHEV